MAKNLGLIETIRELRDGAALVAADEQFRQLVTDIMATGKGGRFVFEIALKPLSQGNARTLVLADEVRVTAPKITPESTILYATDTGELSRKDPRQPELTGLREANVLPIPSKESAS